MAALSIPHPVSRSICLALGGSAAAGLCVSLHASSSWAPAAAVPLVLFGVTAVMIPALYIGTAMIGAAPPLSEMGRATTQALWGAGLVLLGLCPALCFLIATSNATAAFWLARGTIGISVAIGLRVLFAAAFHRHRGRAALLFVVWSLFAIGIGDRLLAVHLPG